MSPSPENQALRAKANRTFNIAIGVLIFCAVAVVALVVVVWTDSRTRDDQQDADADAAELATCQRGNDSRIEINKGTIAGQHLADAGLALTVAVDATAASIEASGRVLIAAATADGPLDPDEQARADAYLAGLAALTDQVEAQLAAAEAAYVEAVALEADAILPLRDCANILEHPEATLPVPSTTTPTTTTP